MYESGGSLTSLQQDMLDEVDRRIYDFEPSFEFNYTTNWLAVITWYQVEPFGSDDVSG